MTPRPHLHADSGAMFIGEGYPTNTLPLLAEGRKDGVPRRLDWSFAGQVTHERRQTLADTCTRMLDAGSAGQFIGTPGFLQGLPRAEYLRLLLASKVVPCPSGPCTPDSFRFYEALEAGCVPLADATTPAGWPDYWPFVYGDDLPFPVVGDWNDLPDILEIVLSDWGPMAAECGGWWRAQKARIVQRLDDDVRAVRDGS
jgi:hypothetical protein